MYGWKLLAVAGLVTAVVVGTAAPTVAQTPSAPHHGAAVTGMGPVVGTMPVMGAYPMTAYNPCCCPMYPATGLSMGYAGYTPMMSYPSYASAQPRRRLFNRGAEWTYASMPNYPVMPMQSMTTPSTAPVVVMPPVSSSATGVAATAPATRPTSVTPTTTAPTPPPLATIPAGYFVTMNGQLVPSAGSSFYFPTEPVQMESPRRGFRLFRR